MNILKTTVVPPTPVIHYIVDDNGNKIVDDNNNLIIDGDR
jgi:hypothetical protein